MIVILAVVITTIAHLFMGALVYKKNPHSATHQLIGALSLILATWNIFNFLALQLHDESTRLLYVQVVMFVTTGLGPIIYLFAQTYPGAKLGVRRRALIAILISSGIIALLSFSPYMFSKLVNLEGKNFTLIPGPAIIPFGANLLLFTTLGFLGLLRKLRKSSGLLRRQFKIVLWSMIISFFLLILTNFIAVVIFASISLTYLGPPFTLIMVAGLAYSVIKHQFLDVKVVLVRSLAFTLLLVALGAVFTTLLFSLALFFLPGTVTLQSSIISAALAFFLMFAFEPLKNFFQEKTEKLFFKSFYNVEEVARELSQEMASTLVPEELGKKVVDTLRETITASYGALVLHEGKNYAVAYSQGHKDAQISEKFRELLSIDEVRRRPIILFDTLQETPLKKLMREMQLSVILRLGTTEQPLGSLLLGEKRSAEVYSEKDNLLFSILVPQLKVALQNALAYEEIRQFNATLRSEVKKATSDLQVANQELKQLDRLKDEFVSIASHELRTPMTAIKDYLWMALAGKGGELTEKQRYYLERSYGATERLIKLVNNLLNISRIESGRVSLDLSKVDMHKLVREVIEEVNARALERKVALSYEKSAAADDEFLVVADVDKIKEVLINLIGNSLKFTDPGGTVKVSLSSREDKVVAEVVDTGAGIPKDNIPTLFQKFGLMEGSYRTNQEASQGTGLGLYISRTIVEMHGGKIWAESEGRGKGATFRFSLPVFTSDEQLKKMQRQFGEKSDAGIIRSSV